MFCDKSPFGLIVEMDWGRTERVLLFSLLICLGSCDWGTELVLLELPAEELKAGELLRKKRCLCDFCRGVEGIDGVGARVVSIGSAIPSSLPPEKLESFLGSFDLMSSFLWCLRLRRGRPLNVRSFVRVKFSVAVWFFIMFDDLCFARSWAREFSREEIWLRSKSSLVSAKSRSLLRELTVARSSLYQFESFGIRMRSAIWPNT